MELTHGSLFSGIGGFDLAAEWMGWQNIFHCEWNPFGQRILKHYWPNAKSYADITKTDFSIHRGTIDVLTGGFPCQPYSLAGKRLGKEDDRHLWPEMLRAIREIQPQWVVGENVFGLINWNGGLVFDEVQADLEAQGYEVQPFVLPACAVNAPHRRDRVWFVAFNPECKPDGRHNAGTGSGNGLDMEGNQLVSAGRKQSSDNPGASSFNAAHSNNDGFNGTENGQGHRKGNDGNAAGKNPTEQPSGCSSEAASISSDSNCQYGGCGTGRENGEETCNSCAGNAPNANGIGLRGQSNGAGKSRFFNQKGTPDNWKDFPTQPPVCSGDDGIPSELDFNAVWHGIKPRNPKGYPENYITFSKWRNESIKAGGNAIVPQVALQIFKAIQELNNAA